uniref:Uncharacterized protein n=1 Tax=Ditylenchus dipsaci TaxID=166011 RepID=A0A915D7U8_9BILA
MSDLSTAIETDEVCKQDFKTSSELPSLSSPSIKTNDKESKTADDDLSGDRAKNWEECLKRVSVFDTVEDFWALYNHIQPASV